MEWCICLLFPQYLQWSLRNQKKQKETEKWQQKKDGSAAVNQIIYVQRTGQKAIVLGKGGSKIKKIGEAARKELEELLGHRVHLMLFVKVRENWADDPARYREMGLEFPKG